MKNILWPIISILFVPALLSCGSKKSESSSSPSSESSSVNAPSALYVDYAVDTASTINVGVGGVASGQTVTLFSDSSCSTQVQSGTAAGTSIDFTISGLTPGIYNYYAKAQSSAGQSACSTASVTYTLISACPAGYVKVPGDATRGIPPFCVMKFEAKNVSSAPASQAAGTPWGNLSAIDAKAECQSLGAQYDLISNQEWMTIADDIQRTGANYNTGVTTGTLSYGNSNNEHTPLAVTDTNDPWNGVTLGFSPTTSHDYKRTFTLSNGEVIWDLAGNAAELVDFDMKSTYTSPPGCSGGGPGDYDANQILSGNHCPAIQPTHYMPVDSASSYAMDYVGSFITGGSGFTLTRGGGYNYMNRSGVNAFHFVLLTPSQTVGVNTGFRCVYRLNTTPTVGTTFAKDFDTTPDIVANQVQYGWTVKLYTDSACNNEVASKVSTGTSTTLTTSTLTIGPHQFYYKILNRAGTATPCSTSALDYEAFTCPAAYIPIAGNSSRSVNPFCVMKYESRNAATSTASGAPVSNVTGAFAKGECLTVNGMGPTHYNLISNAEWMTVADAIASIATNWSTGAVGTGHINSGNTNNEQYVLGISDENDPFDQIRVNFQATTVFQYKRTHNLPGSHVIWDFAGNADEVVDLGTGSTTLSFQTGAACTQGDGSTAYELSAVQSGGYCASIPTTHYMPPSSSYNKASGVGAFIPGQSTGTILRGGAMAQNDNAGIYAYRNSLADANSSAGIRSGYRCVYRP